MRSQVRDLDPCACPDSTDRAHRRCSPTGPVDDDVVQCLVAVGDDLGVHPQAGDRAQVLAVPDEVAGPPSRVANSGATVRSGRSSTAQPSLKLPLAGASTARPVTVTNASGRPSRSTRASSPARTRSGTPAGTVAGGPEAVRHRRAGRPGARRAVSGSRRHRAPRRIPVGRVGRQRPGGDIGFHQAGIPGQRVAEPGGVRACPFPRRVGSHHEHRALRLDLGLGAADRVEVLRHLPGGEPGVRRRCRA